MSDLKPGELEVERSKSTQLTMHIAGGAVFGGLSAVVSFVLSPIINASRIPGWEIAMFDPTSWVWVICFLIFGVYAGLLCCATGSIGLLLIDPSGWVGPLFKFCATVPLILIPYFIFKLKESQKLKNPKNYVVSGLVSTAVRMVIMLGLNLLFFVTIWSEFFEFMDLDIIGLGNITGLSAVLIFNPIINFYTSVLDLAVPYFLVYGSKIDEKFEFW
ncbi:MAG: hypothetical protein ACFE8B_07555 [Candidatus Hermodarchaeota archaeon]